VRALALLALALAACGGAPEPTPERTGSNADAPCGCPEDDASDAAFRIDASDAGALTDEPDLPSPMNGTMGCRGADACPE
jgi:hypothetical protein